MIYIYILLYILDIENLKKNSKTQKQEHYAHLLHLMLFFSLVWHLIKISSRFLFRIKIRYHPKVIVMTFNIREYTEVEVAVV